MFKFLFRLIKWALLLLVALGLVGWFYPEKYLTIDSGPVAADALIVIGGGQHERAVRALELFKQHAAPRIIITGAGDDLINRHFLMANGVPARAIEIEGKSTNTRENAQFTARLLRAERVQSAILVTSWYHSRRAEKTFQHYAPAVRFHSRPSYFGFDRGDWKKSDLERRMRLEFLKLPAYWIWYGINPF
jgi:uncharacterized SAM-binding protein YcdF (DUF218 family)